MAFYLAFILSLSLFQTVSVAENSIGPFQSISDGTTIVSKDGVFEFGFFSLGNSKNRYVGIWYKKIPVQTVVWVANRCKPINDSSGLLTINSTGNLVLLHQNKSIVWSTSSSKQAKKPRVQLLDSGNLVLKDEEDRSSQAYLWQSFDYPSDTLLPGMEFGWDSRRGLNRKLSAWKKWDDPCPEDFSFSVELEHDSYPDACIRKGTATHYRAGPWNGIGISGAPDLRANHAFDSHYFYLGNSLNYGYNLKNSSVTIIIVLNQTNRLLQHLLWMEGDQSWSVYASSPRDYCDKYGICGANGNCVISETAVCQCLEGFKPKSRVKWDLRDWSEGCIRENPLSCEDGDKVEDDFVKLDGIKMPDTRNSWFNDSMNLEECRIKCLNNCSCVAYSNRDIRGEGKGCRIWFGDLMDIRQISGNGQELYIRIPPLELGLCFLFSHASPLTSNSFC
ncbi:hypothetical protein TIFTF001_053019 [Ficus carica]|uniref:Uncharacterized protein n=1 Tax=Ficus carica TaxID=3494 RepID=A0AA88JI57_FICCA|nr:hypothetical protein TIFTF001_053019 [Ficus carica]